MLWNPFQYKFNASYLRDEGEMAVLEIRKGAGMETIRFPKSLLPPSLPIGGSFTLKVEDNQTAQNGEAQTMRQLLSDLIQ